ncbi:MAG TPA: hypothetical protein V6C65_40410 [Allocoleopsis sp.]
MRLKPIGRRLLIPRTIDAVAFDLAGIELKLEPDRMLASCQCCRDSWEIHRLKHRKPAALEDWRCKNGCNSTARESLNLKRGNPSPSKDSLNSSDAA